MCVHTYIYIYICIHVYVYVYICICIYVVLLLPQGLVRRSFSGLCECVCEAKKGKGGAVRSRAFVEGALWRRLTKQKSQKKKRQRLYGL
jgi:hypothetical protein